MVYILTANVFNCSAQKALGPLPNLPDSFCFDLEANSFSLSARVSQIYEEIFDGSRISRASIASGIYEEMNLSSVCAAGRILEIPPALPPLPAHRKRINTFECQPGEIPRCSTNPESELAKKKKYKNMLENIFGQKRRSGSASVGPGEREADEEEQQQVVLYENAPTPESAPPRKRSSYLRNAQRNSFSSPDLSKLNFLDTFGEALSSEELNISLEDSVIEHVNAREVLVPQLIRNLSKADSLESLNMSQQLPHNFNFSACNSSTINLVGANGAVSQRRHPQSQLAKKKVLVDDLNGYCVMAPILPKANSGNNAALLEKKPSASTGSTSSGYSTGSYCSSTSSCNTADEQLAKISTETAATTTEAASASEAAPNESGIYEAMNHGLHSLENNSILAEHLYENLLAVKASQELELGYGLSTSTPTESPLMPTLPPKQQLQQTPLSAESEVQQQREEEEDYYQTPRKSIISVDDKIPSYYPNSCDTMKSKRRSPSNSAETVPGMRHLVSARLRRERKENLYISSPQQIIEQRHKSNTSSSASSSAVGGGVATKHKSVNKKTAAHKISEGVYAVTHGAPKRASQGISKHNSNTTNNNNNNNNELQTGNVAEEELMQLAMLQNIDFKFDDGHVGHEPTSSTKTKSSQLEEEYEHCFQAAERATRMLQKYATLAKFGNSPTKQQQQLQVKASMTQSVATTRTPTDHSQQQVAPAGNSLKKFASLPRFKKIDFSPLKLRFNNVLQRSNATAAPASPQ